MPFFHSTRQQLASLFCFLVICCDVCLVVGRESCRGTGRLWTKIVMNCWVSICILCISRLRGLGFDQQEHHYLRFLLSKCVLTNLCLHNLLTGAFSLNLHKCSCIFIALFQFTDRSKRFTILDTFTHSHTRSYSDGGGCHPCASCSSGAIWGSVSCSRILRHAAGGTRNSNQPPFDY